MALAHNGPEALARSAGSGMEGNPLAENSPFNVSFQPRLFPGIIQLLHDFLTNSLSFIDFSVISEAKNLYSS